jgi:hypothetical protein
LFCGDECLLAYYGNANAEVHRVPRRIP